MSVLCLHRPDSGVCGTVVPVEGQDWTAAAGFNLAKEDVLVLFGPVDFPWFVRRARQASAPFCSVAVVLHE